jgi:molybdate transport system ATP-binding protein
MVIINIFKKLNYYNLNVNFSVDKEMLVIQGSSGSGKTTILDCIAGIKVPDKGEILINESLVFSSEKKTSIPIRDRNVGYVFQNYALFPHMTVKDNINFGLKSKGLKDLSYSDYLLEIFQLKHLKNRYVNQISGGEKQRVALARALATNPKLLLLDEPFSALDNDTRDTIYKEFIEFKKIWKIDIIMITHNDEEANLLGDRIIRIDKGALINN